MASIELRAYISEIEGMLAAGKGDEAAAHSRYILDFYPKHVGAYRLFGKGLLDQGRSDGAADIFYRVLGVAPDDTEAHLGLATIAEENGNLLRAIGHMMCAYEAQSQNTAIHAELKRLYRLRDGAEPSKIQLTRGALARVYLKGRNYAQAVDEVRAALEENPERMDLQVVLAQALWQNGQRVDAVETCQRIVEKLPHCLQANVTLHEFWRSAGRDDTAATHLRRVEGVDPHLAREIRGRAGESAGRALTIPVLDYVPPTPDEAIGAPDWMRDLELEEEPAPAALRDDLSAPPPEAHHTRHDSGAAIRSVPERLTVASPSAGQAGAGPVSGSRQSRTEGKPPSDDVVPDWLRDVGLFGDQRVREEPAIASDIPLQDASRVASTGGEAGEGLPEPPRSVEGGGMAPGGGSGELEELSGVAEQASGLPAAAEFAASTREGTEELVMGYRNEGTAVSGGPGDSAGPSDPDDPLAWLEELASGQGPSSERRPQPQARTEESAQDEEVPDWLREVALAGALSPDPEPAGRPAGPPPSTAGSAPDSPVSREESGEELARHGGVDRDGAPSGGAEVSRDAEETVAWSKPPSVAASEEQPETAIPGAPADAQEATPPEVATEPTAESVDYGEMPEDVDEAIAWLERLAADRDQAAESLSVPGDGPRESEAPPGPEAEVAPVADELTVSAEETDVPAWLREPADRPVAESTPAQSLVPEHIAASDDELPDWMREEADRPAPEEGEAELAVAEQITVSDSDELPEWMREAAVEPVAGSAVGESPVVERAGVIEDEEPPDWLREVAAGPTAVEETAERPVLEPSATAEAEELPDWLREVAAGPAAVEETAERPVPEPSAAAEAEQLPDWLRDAAAEPAAREEAPGPPVAEPAVTTEEAELPDWLRDAAAEPVVEEIAEAAPAEELEMPDWIREAAAEPAIQEVAEAALPELPAAVQEPELPDWIREAAAEPAIEEVAEAAPPEPPAAMQEPEMPDWIREAAAEPAIQEAIEAGPPEPSAAVEEPELPDWMREAVALPAAEEEAEVAMPEPVAEVGEPELPDWLREAAEEPAAEAVEAALAEAPPTVEEIAEAALPEPPAAVEEPVSSDWMREVAAEPVVEVAEAVLPEVAAEVGEPEIPEWLREAAEEPAAEVVEAALAEAPLSVEEIAEAALPELPAAVEEPVSPDWMREAAAEPVAEAVLPEAAAEVGEPEIPEWLREAAQEPAAQVVEATLAEAPPTVEEIAEAALPEPPAAVEEPVSPDWMREVAAEPVAEVAAEPVEEEVAAEALPEPAVPVTEVVSEEPELPAWLREFVGKPPLSIVEEPEPSVAEPAPAPEEPELPEEVRRVAAEPAVSVVEEPQPPRVEPAFSAEELELPDWVLEAEAEPAALEAPAVVEPEPSVAEPPRVTEEGELEDWLRELAGEPAALAEGDESVMPELAATAPGLDTVDLFRPEPPPEVPVEAAVPDVTVREPSVAEPAPAAKEGELDEWLRELAGEAVASAEGEEPALPELAPVMEELDEEPGLETVGLLQPEPTPEVVVEPERPDVSGPEPRLEAEPPIEVPEPVQVELAPEPVSELEAPEVAEPVPAELLVPEVEPELEPAVAEMLEPVTGVAALRKKLAADPADHVTRLALARALLDGDALEEAWAEYGELVAAGKEMEEVLDDLERVVAAKPENTQARRVLGDVYMKRGELDKALQAYSQALDGLS